MGWFKRNKKDETNKHDFYIGALLCCRGIKYTLLSYPYKKYYAELNPPDFDIIVGTDKDKRFLLNSGRIMNYDGFYEIKSVDHRSFIDCSHGKLYFHVATKEEEIIYHNRRCKKINEK